MKLLTRILSLLTIVSLSLFFVNCGGGGGGGTSKEKTQLKKLSKTWSIATTNGADLDGDDRTADFTNFKLTISGTYDSDSPEGPYQYSVTGSRPDPSPWPASGTWEFVNISSGNEGNLVREDDVTMHYKINSNGQLVLNVQCLACDYAGARTSEVNGTWTFTFNP
jgi:hypothetical protein